MAEMCGNCRNFFEPRSGGVCRAHPPVAREDGSARWPSVARSDWCGEYRIAPPPENPGIRRLASV
ncbi:MAG: hypothetical protein FD152_2190 [Xanthobacteraceae bacterium]|nr:MAG: hypothetical protein FD152_2190 [Xanthobacteraceae bacterium]